MAWDSTNATLSVKYAVVEVLVDDCLETDNKDFTFDSDAAPDVDEEYGEELVVARTKYPHPHSDNYSAHSLTGSDGEVSSLKKKLSLLDEFSQQTLFALFQTWNIVAWPLRDLSPAHVPVKHFLELTDSLPTHQRPHRMASKHNGIIRKELDDLLDAGIIVLASPTWSFPVVIASKKNRNLRFCVQYLLLNRVKKTGRWTFPRNEEVFDNLCGSKMITVLDQFSGY